jgi:hypothetical protein
VGALLVLRVQIDSIENKKPLGESFWLLSKLNLLLIDQPLFRETSKVKLTEKVSFLFISSH